MNLTFLIIAAVLLCCFFAAYLWFAVINRRLNDISFGSPFFGNVFFRSGSSPLLDALPFIFCCRNKTISCSTFRF